jgi:hypothetical protein
MFLNTKNPKQRWVQQLFINIITKNKSNNNENTSTVEVA